MALFLLLVFSETKHRAMYKYSTGYKQWKVQLCWNKFQHK
jgi:hypothetical protein